MSRMQRRKGQVGEREAAALGALNRGPSRRPAAPAAVPAGSGRQARSLAAAGGAALRLLRGPPRLCRERLL